jgi:hypothetical protein
MKPISDNIESSNQTMSAIQMNHPVNNPNDNQQGRPYRSMFWPIVLVGIGLIWLLSNLGLISSANISVAFRLWPLILIIVGFDLLFGRKSPVVGAMIGLITVIVFFSLILIGPALGLAANVDIQSASYSEPVADASRAQIELRGAVGTMTVSASEDSDGVLFDASVSYVGEIEYETSGQSQRVISLRQDEVDNGLGFFAFNWFAAEDQLNWDVNLNPDVPMALDINGGVGNSLLDLSDVQLESLDVNSGVGQMAISLPVMVDSYDANINSGTGQIDIDIENNAALNLNVDGGVGQVNIDAPDGVGIRLEAQSGIGNVTVPSELRFLSGDEGLGANGVWETANFDSAERQIVIHYSGGIGGLNIH